MSPEQITDQTVDRRADVYALGLILFELLTGQQVFTGSSPASVIFKHVSEPAPLPSSLDDHISPQIDAIVLKALAKSPEDRYGTAGELATAFRAAAQSGSRSVLISDLPLEIPPGPPAPESLAIAKPRTDVQDARQKWLIRGGLAVLLTGGVLAIVVAVWIAGYAIRSRAPAAGSVGSPPTAQGTALPATSTPLATSAPTDTSPAPTQASATTAPTVTTAPVVVPVSMTSTAVNPPPQPAVQPVGRVRFLSTQSAFDSAHLELAGIQAPPAGKHYEGWLFSATGAAISMGTFTPDGNGSVDHTYTDPEGRNLAAVYSGFRASVEPDFGDGPEMSQEIAFEGALHSAVVPLVREAILKSVERPVRSLLEGLATEAILGQDHLIFARDGFAGDLLAGGLGHAEHTINILVGSADDRFGDKNGDGQTQNPGDGYGVLGYLNALQAKAVAAKEADPSSAELALHADYLQILIQNSLERTEGIVQLVERSFAQDSAASALTLVDQAQTLYDELQRGSDINGNQRIEPIQGEGGLVLVAQHAGYLANIEVSQSTQP